MTVSVLVVDDETDVAELFRRRFRRELKDGSYVLHFAASGEEALAMLDTDVQPELLLILSDINMPGMTGLELLKRVKEMMPDMPVAMVTAYGDDENRSAANAYGAAEFITKPIDFGELKQKVAELTAAPRGRT
ncbi:MAG: response regulator [Alphaproteobacteria bacterium]|nr:response regulator [Alphaproteobacteria bacterium]